MAESWVRLWAGMTTDPKWQTVARKSGQPRALVIALFTHLMLEANEHDDRGSVSDIDIEDIASALDCDEESVEAIIAAMQGRVIEGGRLSGWERRQPQREDSGNPATGALSSTERSRLHRERKRSATHATTMQRSATQCNAPEAEAEAEAEAEKPPSGGGTPPACTREEPAVVAAAPGASADPIDPIHVRAIELTALVRSRGARLNAMNPDVRSWAERGVTDAQLLTAYDVAESRRSERGDPSPVNAGLLNAILRDVLAPSQPRASPGRRQTREESRTIAAGTRLADYRAACAADNHHGRNDDDERTIEATAAPRQLG